MKRISLLTALVVILTIQVLDLRADTILQFNNRAAFDAAVTGETTIDFESLSVADNSIVPIGTSATFSGVKFSNSIQLYARSGAEGLTLGDGSKYIVGNGDANVVAVLPAIVSAAGSDVFGGPSSLTQTGTVTDGNGGVFHFSATVPRGNGTAAGSGFLGFIDATTGGTIVSISYDHLAVNGGDLANIDNFTYGTAVPVPLPSAALAGLVLFGSIQVRRMVKAKSDGRQMASPT
jgi:hypothetical protein